MLQVNLFQIHLRNIRLSFQENFYQQFIGNDNLFLLLIYSLICFKIFCEMDQKTHIIIKYNKYNK